MKRKLKQHERKHKKELRRKKVRAGLEKCNVKGERLAAMRTRWAKEYEEAIQRRKEKKAEKSG